MSNRNSGSESLPRKEVIDLQYETILLDEEDGVAVITLNRPQKLNAINLKMRKEISAVLRNLENNDAVRVIVLTGAGEAFCAGADISEFSDADSISESMDNIKQLYELKKPVVGAVNGPSAGDGSQWALAFDLTVASEKATFSWPAARLGLI